MSHVKDNDELWLRKMCKQILDMFEEPKVTDGIARAQELCREIISKSIDDPNSIPPLIIRYIQNAQDHFALGFVEDGCKALQDGLVAISKRDQKISKNIFSRKKKSRENEFD